MVSGSGSRIGSSSRLSAVVKLDKPVMLVDGDGGIEELGLVPEGISGVGDGRVEVWGCSSTSGSPSDVATGVTIVPWDTGTVVSVSALRRVGGGWRPSQPASRGFKASCRP